MTTWTDCLSSSLDCLPKIRTDDHQPEGLTGPTAGGSCDTFTADGDIREDSHAKPDGSAITRNETRTIDALEPSANHYATRQAKNGEAATREGADVSSTFSNNTRQSAKTRDNRESGRYAPPSCSPEDGNHYATRQAKNGEAATREGADVSTTFSLL